MSTVNCLVCDKPTSITHMGLDVCRACTVFYRRHGSKGDKFRCINGLNNCMDCGRGFYWCRKCRLDRILRVLKAARGDNTKVEFHNPVPNIALRCSDNSIVEKIRANYHKLSVLRLVGELGSSGISVNSIKANEDSYEMIPSTYRDMNTGTKVLVHGLFAFVNSTFPEFREMQNNEKWLLVGKYEMIFHCIDSVLRLKRRFAKDSANFFFSYTSYMSHELVEQFFVNCPNRSNANEASKNLHICFEEIVSEIRTLFKQIEPNEIEFFALLGLAFWGLETFEVGDGLLSLAARYRTLIISELTAQYRLSIGETNAASRVGAMLCVVSELKRLLTTIKPHYQLFQLLGVFDDTTLTYRLQVIYIMPANCLICGKPTFITHMGLDVCRACAVFYKRHRAKANKLLCVNGDHSCVECGGGVFWCRKCRLDRFEAVLRSAWGEGPSTSSPGASKAIEDVKPSIFHSSFNKPLTIGDSIIDRMRAHHRTLSAHRFTTELSFRGITMSPSEVDSEKYRLSPCTYQCMNEGTKVLIVGLVGFISSTFPEFQSLQINEKWLLIRNYEKAFHNLDSALRSVRKFGKESSNCFLSYTTFLSPETMDQFFVDCPDNTHAAVATRTLHSCYQQMVPGFWQFIHHLDPTEDEFFAIIGLAFWSIEAFDASDELLAMASRYRKEIINELMTQYRGTIGLERGTSRIGSFLCLIQEIKRMELNMRTDFEIFKMIGVFDDDTLTYKLQIMHT